ncbi:aminotransferase class V-fold PLP-dependent enzyme [Cryobacterium melibiosiphilum]|uniref:Aminotransferase class V-fold PLP-dependent enzyme n=1 Tax=Cryobacterium melibiosiphilum TaxID=995039 RepID=A0A3A5MEQ3_9MICO|nr:aminotransferase class V-fold PLP-dependent enzyme [Cryobacterium melibiosiphilum]RJT87922.1 aminotransferase class V-fold PLP-dependent enzyme [Cryobacterium melibiosiphilum]
MTTQTSAPRQQRDTDAPRDDTADCPLIPVVGGDVRVPLVDGSETRYINLDYAASAPALEVVAAHITEVLPLYASVHRGAGYASQISTAVYENARVVVGDFVGARPKDTVIFTRNTTDSLNLLASVAPGETVVLDLEHHANLLPWLGAASGARVLRSAATLDETLTLLDAELTARPAALLAVTGASNVTGEVLPLRRLATLAHRRGTRIAVDGAQLVPHRRVDIAALGIDYLAFSGHKTYAPFGAGVLVGRSDWLDAGDPYLLGGGAVISVTLDATEWRVGPARHEAGSPNVIGVAALARALQELDTLDPVEWVAHENELRARLVSGLEALPGVSTYRIFPDLGDAVGVVSFSVAGLDSRLVAVVLSAEWGIGVRDGKFCAHPLLERLGVAGSALRASVGVGSRQADVDALLTALASILADGPSGEYELESGHWQVVNDTRPRPDWAPELAPAAGYYGCAG